MALTLAGTSGGIFNSTNIDAAWKVTEDVIAITQTSSFENFATVDISSGSMDIALYDVEGLGPNIGDGCFQTVEQPYSDTIIYMDQDNSLGEIFLGAAKVNVGPPHSISNIRGPSLGSSATYDMVTLAVTSPTAGYCILANVFGTVITYYLATFSINGTSLSILSGPTSFHVADSSSPPTTRIEGVFGLGDGRSLQKWSHSDDGYSVILVSDPLDGSYVGANNIGVLTEVFGFLRVQKFQPDFSVIRTENGLKLFYYDGSLDGTENLAANWLGSGQTALNLRTESLGYKSGLIVWKYTTTQVINHYLAEMRPDPDTGLLDVQSGDVLDLGLLRGPLYLTQMKNGTEALLVYWNSSGGNFILCKHITGVSGLSPTPSSNRLWLYKTIDNGISWTSRGVTT